MRLLTSKLLRRPPPLPPPPLLHFFSHYSSDSHSVHPLLAAPHRHQYHWRDYGPRCSSCTQSLSPNYYPFLSHRFSTQPNFPHSDEPILPVRVLISLLDSYHDFTGFPWWVIISSSTVAMRLALLPLVVLQLKKLRRIGELMPKLPPPFPPPLSGRSFRDQFTLFLKAKQDVGCPSFFWFVASFAVQAPCFLLWIMSVRRMSLDFHPGFDCGGALWFQNLTEYPHGAFGLILPLFIAGLHFTNVQVSFKSSLQKLPGTLGLLAKFYKIYLQFLTLPILFAAFSVPQGSLVYWLTNSSFSLIQLIGLRHPDVREYFGLHEIKSRVKDPTDKERGTTGVPDTLILTKEGPISAQRLSPKELVSYSIEVLNDGRMDPAITLLRLALEKDPGYLRALVILGHTLLQKKQLGDATDCLESAISKLLANGHPTEVEQVDLLLLSSKWAGIAKAQQGKMEEGLLHLERIAQLEEPENSKSKEYYFDGIFILSSALLHLGRKAEALKHLEKLTAYNPVYNTYFKEMEERVENFARDLAGSRRDF